MRVGIHHLKDALDEGERDVFVKQVAHGIDEDHRGFFPRVRDRQGGFMLAHLEAVLVFLHAHRLQTPGHDLRVTKLASCGNLVAARGGVPREFRPFD